LFFSFWPFAALKRRLAKFMMRKPCWRDMKTGWLNLDLSTNKDSFNKHMGQNLTLSLNEFADLTNEEFREIPTSFGYGNVTDAPPSVDWREKGAVTPIKDQGKCGCCWEFSVVAATERVNQLRNGNLIPPSEQELVDCDTAGQDHGCEGDLMEYAFQFIQHNKGLTTETNYPYQGVDGTSCNTQKAASQTVSINEYEDVPKNPSPTNQISVAIDASGSTFQFYSSGVFTGTCSTNLDHGVTAVDTGLVVMGLSIGWVNNSWGTGWGESGYVRMQRGIPAKEGLCGIAMEASYPTA
ncbi:Cysteine proteinases superfamily protein, partial [Prunus dulcis]